MNNLLSYLQCVINKKQRNRRFKYTFPDASDYGAFELQLDINKKQDTLLLVCPHYLTTFIHEVLICLPKGEVR